MFSGIFRPMHLLVIFIIIAVMFPKRLAELGKGLGEGIFGLRQALGGSSSTPPAAKDDAAKNPKT
jgi:Sec-independent protein translocase protein TatA